MSEAELDPLHSLLVGAAAARGIRHGFFTRKGGVSQGLYRGLNTGVGSLDDPAHVAENRRRVASWMHVAPNELLTAYQIHSADALVVREPFAGDRPKCDALVTDRPGLALGVSSADCGPILFADAERRVVGAAHAGWKGALGGVIESTVAAMEGLGAHRSGIVAALGPSIGPVNYEVGPEFVTRFIGADADNERYFRRSETKGGHAFFDLNAYTVDRLRASGIDAETLGCCTYADEERFFSYRRATHRAEADYGRLISAIVLEA